MMDRELTHMIVGHKESGRLEGLNESESESRRINRHSQKIKFRFL